MSDVQIKNGLAEGSSRCLLKYKEKFPESLTFKIVDLLLNSPLIQEDSYLCWQSHFVSNAGFIDYVKPEDLKKPIMWGIDPHKRLFIAIRTKLEELKDSQSNQIIYKYEAHYHQDIHLKTELGVETFFQCLPDIGEDWASGNYYGHHRFHSNHDGTSYDLYKCDIVHDLMGSEEYQKLSDLIMIGKTNHDIVSSIWNDETKIFDDSQTYHYQLICF